MKTLNEILDELNDIELLDDVYVREILKDIDKWLEEETEKQDYIEENLRSDE